MTLVGAKPRDDITRQFMGRLKTRYPKLTNVPCIVGAMPKYEVNGVKVVPPESLFVGWIAEEFTNPAAIAKKLIVRLHQVTDPLVFFDPTLHISCRGFYQHETAKDEETKGFNHFFALITLSCENKFVAIKPMANEFVAKDITAPVFDVYPITPRGRIQMEYLWQQADQQPLSNREIRENLNR
jgi:hypothetical protein